MLKPFDETLDEYAVLKNAFFATVAGKKGAEFQDDPEYHRTKDALNHYLTAFAAEYDATPKYHREWTDAEKRARKATHAMFDIYCEEHQRAVAMQDAPDDFVRDEGYKDEDEALEAAEEVKADAEDRLDFARALLILSDGGF